MAKIIGNFNLVIENELTDKMKIWSRSEVPSRIQTLFNKAIELVTPHVKPDLTTVVFSRGPFPVSFADNEVGIYIVYLIAFDLNKLEKYADDSVIVAFLEEFLHCLRHIYDETKVGYEVAKIYPKVAFDGNKYIDKE